MTDIKLQQIHDASMRILERTGMRFLHPETVQVLKDHGIRVEGNVAYFKEEQIMEWIKKVPPTFEFHARNPKHNVVVGGDNSVVAPPYGAPHVCDAAGNSRDALMEDYIKFCKLFHANPFFKINGGWMVHPNDKPAEHAPELMHLANILYSDKCCQTGAGNRETAETLAAMTKAVFGNLDHPYMLTIVNTNSPLQLDVNMADTMIVFGKYRQPVAITACVMTGSTGPVTLAGDIALGNAEVLATIALSQMMNPGTPVLYGMQSGNCEMASMGLVNGTPESALCRKYGAMLAKSYGLPCRGGGAYTDAKDLSIQAGYESMLTYYTTIQSKMNYIIFGAGIVDGVMAMSYEKLMVDFEINEMMDRLMKDVEVNEETLAVDLVHEIGHGGNYLSTEHTFRHCRNEFFMPKLAVRGNSAVPGRYEEHLRNRLNDLFDAYEQPELDSSIVAELKSILQEKGIDPEL